MNTNGFDRDKLERKLREIMDVRIKNHQQRESPNPNQMEENPQMNRYYDEEPAIVKKGKQPNFNRMLIGGIITAVAVIFALIVFFNAFTIIQPGHGGVQYSLAGGLKDKPTEVLNNGMKWHAPWVNVYEYPTSTEIEKRIIIRNESGKITSDDSITVNTGDGKSVKVAYTYNYSMEQDKLPHIFTKFRRKSGPQIADQYIDQQFMNTIQNIATNHSVLQVYSQNRGQINKEVFDKVKHDLGVDGINLEQFTIVDVIPDEKTLAVLQQIADEQNKRELVIRQRNTLAEQELNIAQQNKNNIKKAEGDKSVAEIGAKQKATTLELEAAGQAKANRELAGSITQPLIDMKKLEILPQVKWPVVMGGGGNILNMPESLLNGGGK